MLTKTVTYTDLDGNEVTEKLNFNVTKRELVALEARYQGGLQAGLQRIIDAQDNQALYNEFEWIILFTYGERSEDGRHFRKSEEITANFRNSLAYDEFFWGLVTNEEELVNFIVEVLPKEVQGDIREIARQQGLEPPAPLRPVEDVQLPQPLLPDRME